MKRQTGEKDCINIEKTARLDGEHGSYLKISLQNLLYMVFEALN